MKQKTVSPKINVSMVAPESQKAFYLFVSSGAKVFFAALLILGPITGILTQSSDATAASYTISFATPVTYALPVDLGWYESSPIPSDFNEDGYQDIAGIHYTDNTMSVILNNGDGTFGTALTYTTSASPYSITTSDVNRDGTTDIVIAGDGGYIDIFIGAGDGTFADAVSYNASHPLYAILAVDLNNDTFPDLVSQNAADAVYAIFLNNGDSTFGSAIISSAGGSPYGKITSAYLNNDTYLDLVFVNCFNPGNITVVLNNGDGTFANYTSYATNGIVPCSNVIAADFNNDDIIDFATADKNTDDLSILIGAGDGTFAAGVTYASGDAPWASDTYDFNKDGNMDIITVNHDSDNISLFLGNGDGTFQTAASYAVGDGPYSVPALVDFNKDGNMDIAIQNTSSDNITVLMGDGSGSFSALTAIPVGDAPYGYFAVADYNNDGLIDLALANTNDHNVSVLLNTTVIRSGKTTSGSSIRPRTPSASPTPEGNTPTPADGLPYPTDSNNQPGEQPNTQPATVDSNGWLDTQHQSDNAAYKTKVNTLIPSTANYKHDLYFNLVDEDVRSLQSFLNTNGYTVADSGVGSSGNETNYFGPKTLQALMAFQEAFAPSILTPLGLTSGTGYFGEWTRKFVNALVN